MDCRQEQLVGKVCEIYDKISRLENLNPCKHVNTLFSELVQTCLQHPCSIDVTKFDKRVQEIRSKLIRLCGEAEGLLESHFSALIGSHENQLDHISSFPYYSNYLKLSSLEFCLLSKKSTKVPNRVAFVGSGALPVTSIILATYHQRTTCFHNARVIDHLAKHMAPGAILLLRGARGARAFLYPDIDPCDLLGFEVLSVFHPTDEVINSVIIARNKNASSTILSRS